MSAVLPLMPSGPVRMKVFRVILLGQTLSMFGSALTRFAIGVWAYQTTGSVTAFSLILFCGAAPSILLSPFIGVLVDRWDRRWAMILSDAGAGAMTLTLALLLWNGQAALWQICLVVAFDAAFGTLQFPAASAYTTFIVPKEYLGRANGMAHFGVSLASLVAPLAAGFLIQTVRIGGIFLLDGITCLIAVLSLLVIRLPGPEPERGQEHRSFLAESTDGWTYLRSRPGLLGLLVLFAVINFAMGMVETLITPLVLGFASSAVLGMVSSGAGVGMLAGGLLMMLWTGPEHRVKAILGALAIQGATLLVGGLRPNALLIGIAAFFYLACVPIINTCSQTIWQSKVPLAMQGRVFAMRQMVVMSSLPLATLVAGPLADHVFEPLLVPGGPLVDTAGRWLGVGPGRGIGLLFMALGGLILLAAALAHRRSALRNVESELPDTLPQMT